MEGAFAPHIWHGAMMDVVRGRAVSRQRDSGQIEGLLSADAALLLAGTAPADRRAQIIGRALGWITSTPLAVEDPAPLARVARWLRAQASGAAVLGDEPGHRLLVGHERFVHRREDWAFTVSPSSSRIGRYE